MAKNSQVNIRFDDLTDAQLEQTASELGVSKSALVRHLTKSFLEEVRRTGSLKLRPDWKSMIDAADGRSAWGESKLKVAEGGPRESESEKETKPTKYPVKKRAPRKSNE